MHDVVIRDASIVDGTGAPAFRGSVAIDGARIAAVGLVPDQGAREIDAEGRVVCPGFIDVHTHSDLMLLAEPAHEPKVRQGVTTDLLGLDGIGYAPLTDHLQPAFRDYFAALNGDPPISRDWSTVAGWLDTFESAAACNVAHHGPAWMRAGGVGRLGRPPGDAGRAARDAADHARGLPGRGRRALHRPGLQAVRLCRHR